MKAQEEGASSGKEFQMVVYVLYMAYSGMGAHPLGAMLAVVDWEVEGHLLFLCHLLLSLVLDALAKLLGA